MEIKGVAMAKVETTYRVIAFGGYEFGWFNQPRWAFTFEDAMAIYKEFEADPVFDGAVLIEVQHETWQVIKEFGTEEVSVVYGPLGNFKVSRAPKLIFV
jgi:hypothetical protein